MGGLKRVSEKLKQALGIKGGSSAEWKPTSNARNLAMIKEVRKFAQLLKQLHKDLSGMDKAVEGPLGVMPSDPQDRLVGANVNIEAITAAQNEMTQRLKHEVLHPIEQWLAAYRSIKERNKKCEEVRLDLDTKRRQTIILQEKFQKLKAKEHKDAEPTMYKAQNEEDKMNRLAQRYAEVEAEVFNALLTLIKDTAVLREYAAAALAIVQRGFTLSYTSFDLTTPLTLPMLPPPAVPSGYPPVSYNATGSDMTNSLRQSGSVASYGGSPQQAKTQPTMSRPATTSSGGAPQAVATSSNFSGGVPPRAPPSPNAEAAATSAGPFATPGPASAPPMPAYPAVPPAPAMVGSPVPAPSPAANLPPPPAWYTDAKKNAKPPAYDDSDDEGGAANPFASEPKAAADNPFADPKSKGGVDTDSD